MQYRREIDGLRALAVVPVVLFHAGFSAFSGGFVGVDVFFVISGYLITSIIVSDVRSERFSLARFYERRVRRIVPALFLVLFVSIPFAFAWLSPGSLNDYSGSLTSIAAFASNVYFWLNADYFDTATDLKPLLHTWSLAVEEQFYLVYPAVLLLLVRLRPNRLVGVLGAGLVISFGCGEWMGQSDIDGRFYLFPFRAWELLLGALCAVAMENRRTAVPHAGFWSWIGLTMIVVPIGLYDKTTPFPGIYALPPTLGTALIIVAATPATRVGALLARPVPVGIGLVSYSAYLWHQPLLAFARIRSLDQPSVQLMSGLCISAFVLAAFSWRFVEMPIRRGRQINRAGVFALAAAGSLLIAGIGMYGRVISDGRLVSADTAVMFGDMSPAKFSGILDESGRNCSSRPINDLCVFSAQASQRNWVIIGDSHARVLSQALYQETRSRGEGFIDMSTSGCPFVPGFGVTTRGQAPDLCTADYNNARLSYLLALRPSVIVVASRLPFYLGLGPFDNKHGFVEEDFRYMLDNGSDAMSSDELIAAVGEGMSSSYARLLAAGHTLVLVGPVPEHGWNVVERVGKLVKAGYTAREIMLANAIDHKAVQQRQQAADAMLRKVGEDLPGRTVFIDTTSMFCDRQLRGLCVSSTPDAILYADGDHLSETGNRLVVKQINGALGLDSR